MIKVISWNVNQRMSHARARATATWLAEQHADVILLQEVACGRDEVFDDALAGTHHWRYGRRRGHEGLHGAAIALSKKFDVENIEPVTTIAPELVVGLRCELGTVLSVHIPNGSSWGWGKIKVWQELQRRLNDLAGSVIVGGDFNAPALEPPTGQTGTTYCFGHRVDGRSMSPAIAAALRAKGQFELPEDYWNPWDIANRPEGTAGDGRTWEQFEAWIYRSESHFVDAYRTSASKLPSDLGYSHCVAGKLEMRYDHLFTRGFRSESAGYLREHLRRHVEVEQTTEHGVGEEKKPDPYLLSSDHAPLVVVLDVLSPS